MVTEIRGPVITGWSAVSPYGIGREAFMEGARSGRTTAVALDSEQWSGPDQQACLVPDFDIRGELGRKGTRSMDRVTGLAVTAVGRLLKDGGEPIGDGGDDRAALVLGTNTGSAQSMMALTHDTFVQDKPYLVDPAQFPNTVMNCASGQCAIWYGLKGPNATVAGGRSSGLLALNYARRLLAAGRARTVLCGAVEEYSSARSWLEWHTRGDDESDVVLGEGCAVLRLSPADAVAEGERLAEVLAVESAVMGPDGAAAPVAAVVERALRRAGAGPEDVWAVSPSSPAGALGGQERSGLQSLFGGSGVRWVPQPGVIGDNAAATAAFQMVSVLTAAQDAPQARGRVAVITSVDRDGAIACALLRLL
ncbi:beta-ketoacyl synthase N-terminal-like domain-containing protein [Streptomyces sp. NPDC052811]|uniref:beta-ketoacyl synthase N-terminal-like domain-containing protein n=2 Tax=unclassified Streptomyces TaxID=2593676 RepID=UPI003449B344